MFGQCPISFYDLETLIPRERDMALEIWAEKSEFESTKEYRTRIKTQFQAKKAFLGDSILNVYKERFADKLPQLKYEILGESIDDAAGEALDNAHSVLLDATFSQQQHRHQAYSST